MKKCKIIKWKWFNPRDFDSFSTKRKLVPNLTGRWYKTKKEAMFDKEMYTTYILKKIVIEIA